MESGKEIISVLRKNLADYMDSRPSLSLRSVAKLSGCNRYFLGKLVSDCPEVKNYDFNQIVLLLKFLNEKDSLRATVESAESPVRDALMAVFKPSYESRSGSKKLLDVPVEFLYDFDCFMIITLASIKNMSLERFGKCYPENRAYKIDYLIEREIIEIQQGIIKLTCPGEYLEIPLNVIELHIPEIIKRYFTPAYGKKQCVMSYLYQCVNREGLTKLHEVSSESVRKVSEIMANEKYVGDIPVYSINVMNSFFGDLKRGEHI